MFKPILKYALRSILRSKSYLYINLIGFTIGFTIALLIFSWASFELSYDNFHEKHDRIFRVIEKQNFQGQDEQYLAQIPEYLTNTFERDIPEIEASTVFTYGNNFWVKANDGLIEINNVLFTDNKAFDIFSFDFIAGDPKNALTEPFTIVITQTVANKLFNEESSLGKTVELDNNKSYIVTGIIKDLPRNSHILFNILASIEERKPDWNYNSGNHNACGYVLLKQNSDIKSISPKLQILLKKYLPNNANFIRFQLQPLKDIHLKSTFTIWEINWNKFDIKYVRAFILIAFLILLIVISNYINLTIAYSTKRNIEVGIKKIIGAKRHALIMQLHIEALLILLISFFAASVLFKNLAPLLQNSLLKGYNFYYSDSSMRFYIAALLILFIGLLAAIYPSLVFTSSNPVSALKNNFSQQVKGHSIRKILTEFQFVITIALIVSLLTIAKQVNYLKAKNLGYNTEFVILLTANKYVQDHYEDVRENLLKYPSILGITHSNTSLSSSTWRNSIYFEDQQENSHWETPYMTVDYNFFDFYKMNLMQGRTFSRDYALDKQERAFIINETLAKKLNYQNPIGKIIRNGETGWGEIIGVVKDFNYSSLHNPIEPILFFPSTMYLNEISIKISGNNIPGTLKFLESKWAAYNPNRPFSYKFLDETIAQFYIKEEDTSRLIILFSIISIFLSVIGLFGMVVFLVNKRAKEIGIRKVNGARVIEIMAMLNKDFIKWVAIAFVVACPIAWYAMHKWLENFAYKTTLSWWVFVAAGAVAVAVALITISWQSWRAATRNPVESLRYE
jgi:putative ABC transport system permease protein